MIGYGYSASFFYFLIGFPIKSYLIFSKLGYFFIFLIFFFISFSGKTVFSISCLDNK